MYSFPAAAAKVARMLLVLALFGQIIFMVVADVMYQGEVTLQLAFGITYLMSSLLQVSIGLITTLSFKFLLSS